MLIIIQISLFLDVIALHAYKIEIILLPQLDQIPLELN